MINHIINKGLLTVKANYALYRLYAMVRHPQQRQLFPNKNTELFVTGYQRSGNTYSYHMATQLFPTVKLVTHLHLVCSLKQALKYRVPTIILIRDPVQSVASSVVQSVSAGVAFKQHPRTHLAEYVDYYRYVSRHRDWFDQIIDFTDLIANPRVLVEAINRKLGGSDVAITEDQLAKIDRWYKKTKAEKKQDDGQRGIPTPEKQARKERVIRQLAGLPMLLEAQQLYGALSGNQSVLE